ncbi:hypothetical protein [Dryocola sp. BD626]|uniref:hypothetical protein n=1 Tax=Dryocola sp. BD626 TaxID=3133273 RepID=UPI003F4FD435
MKAYVLGDMNGLDSWKMVERETPQPGYAFDEAKTALADLVKGQHVGKLVIRVS